MHSADAQGHVGLWPLLLGGADYRAVTAESLSVLIAADLPRDPEV